MSAVLHSIQDPRDQLQRARRMELYRFARDNGIADIVEAMPADVMRQILRNKGITSIAVPDRQLGAIQRTETTPTSHKGQTYQAPRPPEKVVEVDATSDLMRQWQQESQPAVPREKPVEAMSINELREACKRRGIKLARTDNMASLKEKLNGQNAP